MADTDFRISLNAELDPKSLGKVESDINKLDGKTINLKLDAGNVKQQVEDLKNALKDLANYQKQVGNTPMPSAKNATNQIKEEYKQLISLSKEIGQIKTKLKGLNYNDNAGEITELRSQLKRLNTEYQQLIKTTKGKLSDSQLNEFNRVADQTERKLKALSERFNDLKVSQSAANSYKEILAVVKEFENTKLKLVGLDDNSKEAVELKNRLNDLLKTVVTLKSQYRSSLSGDQISDINAKMAQALKTAREQQKLLNAQQSDKSAIEKANQNYKELIATIKEFERLSIKISGVDQASEEYKVLDKQLTSVIDKMEQLKKAGALSAKQLNGADAKEDQSWEKIINAEQITKAKEADKQAVQAEKDAVQKLNQEFSQLVKYKNELGSLKLSIVGVDNATDEFKVLDQKIKEVEQDISKISNNWTSKQSNALKNIDDKWASKLDIAENKLKDNAKSKADSFKGTYDADLAKLESDLKKIQTQSDSTKEAVKRFKDALNQMNDAIKQGNTAPEKMLSYYNQYQETLRVAKTNISADLKRNVNDLDRQKLSNNMQQWLNQNTKAAKAFGNEVRELIAELKNCDNVSFGNIKKQFSSLQAQAKAQGLTGQSFFSSISSKMKELSAYYTAADVLQRGVQVVEDMARNVAAVDKSMTELYRVTDLSEQAYDSLYKTMVADAKQYGAELDVLINSTASWVRLGFGADEAEKLAGVSAMYQHVTDLDEKTAVENLVTTYKGYQNQLLELTNGDTVKAVSLISDKLDALGNKLPVTAADVGSAMTRMSSVAEMAGASIDEAMGMVVGSGAVTQDFEKTANALRTSMLRIRGKHNMPPYVEIHMLCA